MMVDMFIVIPLSMSGLYHSQARLSTGKLLQIVNVRSPGIHTNNVSQPRQPAIVRGFQALLGTVTCFHGGKHLASRAHTSRAIYRLQSQDQHCFHDHDEVSLCWPMALSMSGLYHGQRPMSTPNLLQIVNLPVPPPIPPSAG